VRAAVDVVVGVLSTISCGKMAGVHGLVNAIDGPTTSWIFRTPNFPAGHYLNFCTITTFRSYSMFPGLISHLGIPLRHAFQTPPLLSRHHLTQPPNFLYICFTTFLAGPIQGTSVSGFFVISYLLYQISPPCSPFIAEALRL
jgi:hypothetical protein